MYTGEKTVLDQILRIGLVQAASGTKSFGFLKVGQTSSSNVAIPIMIVNGAKEGAKLALTAGVHGCEYSGIEAVIRIFNLFDPKELRGAIIAVPAVNTLAFQSRTPYVCPVDGVNLNRVFPGDPDGSISYKIAHALFQNVVKKADFLIDLHGPDLPEELPPHGLTLIKNVDNEKVNKFRRIWLICLMQNIFSKARQMELALVKHVKSVFLR